LIEHGASAPFLNAMRRLADGGRSLDINGPRSFLAAIPRLAREVPGLRIIVDHAGSPGDPTKLEADWREGIAALRDLPNVFCKLSGLPEQVLRGADGAPTEAAYYRPILDALWQSFGADRLIFGSNWPVSNKGTALSNVVRMSLAFVREKGDEAAQKIMRSNAAKFYRWPGA
jgi:L-fuconolactonase